MTQIPISFTKIEIEEQRTFYKYDIAYNIIAYNNFKIQ